ncbi:hypothetical protein Tco_0736672 [Tanacetum coccineum]
MEIRDEIRDIHSRDVPSVSLNLLSRTRKFGHSTMELRSLSLGRQCQMVSAENNTSGPVHQCQMTFEQRSSSLGHQCSKRRLITSDQASVFMKMTSVHISSGLVLHQMTSDHNRSELGIQDHSNEQSSSKLVPKVVP